VWEEDAIGVQRLDGDGVGVDVMMATTLWVALYHGKCWFACSDAPPIYLVLRKGAAQPSMAVAPDQGADRKPGTNPSPIRD
jgi:hypothetical protein